MNYYHRYSGDYIKKTLDLDMVEDGAYTRLLDWMYANERDVPHAKRYTLTRCQTPVERRAVDTVLAQYFQRSGDHWSHERAQEDIDEARPRIEAARENGKKGGRPKGSKNKPKAPTNEPDTETQEKPSGLSEKNPDATQSESSPYPIPHINTPGAVKSTSTGDGAPPGTFAPTLAGEVGMAMRRAGVDVSTVNLADPRLSELLRQGATVDEFEGLAREAVGQAVDSPWPWVLSVLPKRRAKAQQIALAPPAQPAETDRQRIARERVAEAAGVYADRVAKPAPGAKTGLTINDDEVIHVGNHIPAIDYGNG